MSRGEQCFPFCCLSPTLISYHRKVASIPLGEVNRESCSFSSMGDPLLKALKLVWSKQLTRLPCSVVYVKFQFEIYLPNYLIDTAFVQYHVIVLNDTSPILSSLQLSPR